MSRHDVVGIDALSEGTGRCFDVAGERVAVFLVDGAVHAIGDRCSHAEASLAEGEVFGTEVECPRHGAAFDMLTGEPGSLPATRSVPVYVAGVEDGTVYVELPSPSSAEEAS